VTTNRKVDFFVAGGQKCGTTALHALLQRHDAIEMSHRKEPHFFDDESMDWDAPDYSRLHSYYDWSRDALRGEATPIYAFWEPSLGRVHAYNPDARIVIALRHPAQRAHSQWKMEITRGRETLPFAAAIRHEGRSRRRVRPQRYLRRHSYVERGFYADQIRRAIDTFGRDHVHFLRTDRMWSDGDEVVGGVLDFLGVERRSLSAGPEYVVKVEGTSVEGPSADDLALLHDLYAEDIAATAELTGLDLGDWLAGGWVDPMRGGSAGGFTA
jgi:hypothetical protein